MYSAQLRTWYFFCFACLYWQRLGYYMLEHTSATTIGGFRSQPERCNNADSWQGSFLFPAFYRRGLFGLVLLRLPQSVTADVELQDDAVMYKSVDGQSSSSNLAKQSIVEARGRLIA